MNVVYNFVYAYRPTELTTLFAALLRARRETNRIQSAINSQQAADQKEESSADNCAKSDRNASAL